MGLDSVELVMEWEDEFEIEIPDAHCERMQTIGDVVKYVEVRYSCLDDIERMADIRHRVCVIVSEQMGVSVGSLSDETRFIEDLHVD
jgi:acyl carrier protein